MEFLRRALILGKRVVSHWRAAKLESSPDAEKARRLRSIFGAQNQIRLVFTVALSLLVAYATRSTVDYGERVGKVTTSASRGLILVVGIIIVVALLLNWFYFTRPTRREGRIYPLDNVLLVDSFPLFAVYLDFLYLSILLFATGGASSNFLPLAVIALLTGDVAIVTKKSGGEEVWSLLVGFSSSRPSSEALC